MARQKKLKGFLIRFGRYHVITDPITGKQLSTKCTDPDAALMWLVNRQREKQNPAIVKSHHATVGEYCDKLIDTRRAGKATGETIKFWKNKLKPIRRIFREDTPLAKITPATFDNYAIQRSKEPGKRGGTVRGYTITRELRGFLQALRLAKRAGEFAGDLEALMPAGLEASYKPVERALTESEAEKLLMHLPTDQWSAFAAVIISMGSRTSEACRLRPEDIESRIEITKDKDGNDVEVERLYVWIDGRKTKASNRVVAVLSPFTTLLKSAIPSLPIGKLKNVWRTFNIASRKAGIAHCSPNDLRRTWTSLCGAKGVSDEFLAKLLGHTTITMCRRVYNQAKAEQLAPVVEGILARSSPIEIAPLQSKDKSSVPGRRRRSDAEGGGHRGGSDMPAGSRSEDDELRNSATEGKAVNPCTLVRRFSDVALQGVRIQARHARFEPATFGSGGEASSSEISATYCFSANFIATDCIQLTPVSTGCNYVFPTLCPGRSSDADLNSEAENRSLSNSIRRRRAKRRDGDLVPLIGAGGIIVGWVPVTEDDIEADLAPHRSGAFTDRLDRADREISKAILGSSLTTPGGAK